MIKPISTPWNSLIWTESPLKDSFRLADLTPQQKSCQPKKVSDTSPGYPQQVSDTFELGDNQLNNFKSLIKG